MSSNSVAQSRGAMLAMFLGLALVGAAAGLFFTRGGPVGTEANGAESHAGEPGSRKPPMHDWPTPAVTLLLSGEMHGYIEPCGCTAGQTGGLARRAWLVESLEEKRGWNVVGLSLGGSLDESRVGRVQTRMKFDFTREALEGMEYATLALGREESKLPLRQDDLLQISTEDQQKPDWDLRFNSANVLPYPGEDLGISERFQIIETPAAEGSAAKTDQVKIAVTSVLGESMSQGILGDDFFQIQPPAEALAEVLPKMQAARPDLMILLSYCKPEESELLAKAFPAFDIVVTAGGPEDPNFRPEYVGKTMLLEVGKKGKNVGFVGFYPGNAEQRLRYELVEIDGDRFKNHPRLHQMMQDYQDRLREERPDLLDNAEPPPHPSGRTYVGAEKCGECHDQAYAKWASTGHSHAFAGLTTGRPDHEGPWVDRKWDAECLACHVTGWHPQQAFRYESGFIDEMKTPHLANNQCENCHGPGSRHVEIEEGADVADGETEAERMRMWISKEDAEHKLCRQCHDGDNDPHFDFETYWPKIAHPED
jgi:hypothetical protein